MNTVKLGKGEATVRLDLNDLALLSNALNEVCNGVHISDAEFETRLGVTRSEARELLARIQALLRQAGT